MEALAYSAHHFEQVQKMTVHPLSSAKRAASEQVLVRFSSRRYAM